MTKYPSSELGVSPGENNFYFEDSETDISGAFSESFPGAQHFNEIMHEKMRPKIAKFKPPKNLRNSTLKNGKLESDF